MKIKELIKKKLSFPWYNSPKWDKYFNFWIENPFKTWWLGRKYFKMPKPKFNFFITKKYSGYPYASYHWLGKILDINIHDVEWKDKWHTPRHERNPLIYICLFRTIGFSITCHITYRDEFGERKNGDMEYWEYLLNWLYYKDKKTLRCYSAWSSNSKLYRQIKSWGNKEDGTEDVYEPFRTVTPCVAMSLNKRGIKKLKEELNNG